MKNNRFGGRRKSSGETTSRHGLYLVAFLCFHGVDVPLSEHDQVIYFDVPDDEETRQLMQAFREDELVPVLQFARSLQKVRGRLFEAKKNISARLPTASVTKSDPQSAEIQP